MATLVDRFFGLFSTDMGIDLGTCNTLVCVRGQEHLISEPSVVAINTKTGEVLLDGAAVGDSAKEMLDKCPGNIQAVRPLRDGVIADFEITEALLTYFIRKVHARRFCVKPRTVISVPIGITNVEKRAVINSAERAGAREVFLVEQPFAAAIGAGLPVDEPMGSMICDIGGGTTDVAVTSLAGIVVCETLKVAGDAMDRAIIDFVGEHHGLRIGVQTAERIKIEIGSAFPLEEELALEIRGQDAQTSMPSRAQVTSIEIREALMSPVTAIVRAIRTTLEHTPPELAADLCESGLTMAGGGALLRGIDQAVMRAIDLPVKLASDPLTAVVRGTGVVLERLDLFADVLESGEEAA